ncbi:alpha/beta hydrolase [Orenia marismortui]|uniref:alpha/beta hydrolase n=1 Tax=Orenia marismortui TaxID=46469 RepID=UPI00037B1D9D|nr:alpha/beta hydrolase-fold protein [Orenia marismortui]
MKNILFVIISFVLLITYNHKADAISINSDEKIVDGYVVKEYQGISNLELIKDFDIPQFKGVKRDLLVYLPVGYKESNKRYPVLYMHDAQNLFTIDSANYGGWQINKTLERLIAEDRTEGVIIVGVYNDGSNRASEYSPWEYWLFYNKIKNPLGEEYVDFIVNKLKPYIDKNYRTLSDRENTGIAGSSLGGLISFYAGLRYQNVFSKIGVFSPYFTAEKAKIKEVYNFSKKVGKRENMKICFYVGGKEFGRTEYDKNYLEATKEMYNLLKDIGFDENELRLLVDKKAVHNERYWAKYFPEIFLWLYE